jgi:hypothetical protein
MAKKPWYRVRNWDKYNEALVQRGSITFWWEEASVKKWYAKKKKGKQGRPFIYSELAIICGLTLKGVYHLAFRQTEGLLRSLIAILKLKIKAPDYSSLCKRQKGLEIKLPKVRRNENLHVVFDSTGLKVYGEGEWKVRQHGYVTKRLWRKLHLAINTDTQEIEACELTDLKEQDCEAFGKLVEKIDGTIMTGIGDGAYDRFSCYEQMEKKGAIGIFPPQRNSRTSQERRRNKKKASEAAVKKRDEAIKAVRKLGRKKWKKKVGYHRRSLAETGMFRVKTVLGNKLSTRIMEHQQTESKIWCSIINKMTKIGMPQTVAL